MSTSKSTSSPKHGKRVIVAMSTSSLDYHFEEHDIRILRLTINMGDKSAIDGTTITCDDFQRWLLAHPNELASTSPPSQLTMRKFFLGLMDEGFDEVLFIGMSSLLSKTCEHVRNIIPLLHGKMKVHVFDTCTGTFTEGLMALEAQKCFAKGWSTKKTIQRLEMLRQHQQVYFGVDNLKYLVNNGRLSYASGLLANFLNIKPLIHVTRAGAAEVAEKIFSTQRVMLAIAERINAHTREGEYRVFTLYSGTGSATLHRELQTVIAEQCGLNDLPSYPISPVVAAHIGPYAFGAGLFKI